MLLRSVRHVYRQFSTVSSVSGYRDTSAGDPKTYVSGLIFLGSDPLETKLEISSRPQDFSCGMKTFFVEIMSRKNDKLHDVTDQLFIKTDNFLVRFPIHISFVGKISITLNNLSLLQLIILRRNVFNRNECSAFQLFLLSKQVKKKRISLKRM